MLRGTLRRGELNAPVPKTGETTNPEYRRTPVIGRQDRSREPGRYFSRTSF
jgi:hypothetical protein